MIEIESYGPSALSDLPKYLNRRMPPDGSPGCLYLGKLCWPDGDGRLPTGDDLAEFNRLIKGLVEGGYVLGAHTDVVFVPLAEWPVVDLNPPKYMGKRGCLMAYFFCMLDRDGMNGMLGADVFIEEGDVLQDGAWAGWKLDRP